MSADREAWDRAARGYARQERLERRAIAAALDLAAVAADELLLDVATGTGLVLRELARRAVRPARAIGIDRSPGMLACVGRLPEGWRVQQGDALALPLADDAADVAVAAYLLHLLAPRERSTVLAELRRVLRPGGRLVVVTMFTARPTGTALLAGLARAAPRTLGGLRPLDPRPGLAAAGWKVERAAALRGGYPSLVVRARPG